LKVISYRSNGKLLLTGEYIVLFGAISLAIPTKYGQSMVVAESVSPTLRWSSEDINGTWFQAEFSLPELQIVEASDRDVAGRLSGFLREAFSLTAKGVPDNTGYDIHTKADFNRHWGLGTSSTLIVNIARWLNISPWDLYWKTFKGSGYDIACALSDAPIIYKLVNGLPVSKAVTFRRPFLSHIHFVYTGRKMDTQKSVADFRKNVVLSGHEVDTISTITRDTLKADNADEFMALLEEHEHVMSKVLKLPVVKARLFPDFKGAIKSLGAWGGDFMLTMAPGEKDGYVEKYFKNKGYQTVVAYGDMALGKGE
jgi:mevalonate kinase